MTSRCTSVANLHFSVCVHCPTWYGYASSIAYSYSLLIRARYNAVRDSIPSTLYGMYTMRCRACPRTARPGLLHRSLASSRTGYRGLGCPRRMRRPSLRETRPAAEHTAHELVVALCIRGVTRNGPSRPRAPSGYWKRRAQACSHAARPSRGRCPRRDNDVAASGAHAVAERASVGRACVTRVPRPSATCARARCRAAHPRRRVLARAVGVLEPPCASVLSRCASEPGPLPASRARCRNLRR